MTRITLVENSSVGRKPLRPLRGRWCSPFMPTGGIASLNHRLMAATPCGVKAHAGPSHRRAATLVEVLVAIFVMAIGMLALLALFPLGVLRMAQAIQDARTAQAAANAEELARFRRIRYDADFQSLFTTQNPNVALPVDPDGPSYPILVDPLGHFASSLFGPWLAKDSKTNIQRQKVSWITDIPPDYTGARRWFSFLDDLGFENDGTARVLGGEVEREIIYTWAYLCQRPRAADPNVVNLSVVAFKGRSVSLTALQNGDLTLAETYYGPLSTEGQALFIPTNNTVVFDYSGPGQKAPAIRAGDWILDSTAVLTKDAVGGGKVLADDATAQYRTAHGNFYRVVGITELSDTQLEAELETPLRGFPADANATFMINGETAYPGTAVIIENIVEVFDKGPG